MLFNAITNSVTQTVPATFAPGSITPLPGFFLFGVNIAVGATSIDFAFNGNPGGTAPTEPFDGYVFNFAGAPTITGVSLGTKQPEPTSRYSFFFRSGLNFAVRGDRDRARANRALV